MALGPAHVRPVRDRPGAGPSLVRDQRGSSPVRVRRRTPGRPWTVWDRLRVGPGRSDPVRARVGHPQTIHFLIESLILPRRNWSIHGPSRTMAEHRSHYNGFGLNQVGVNPRDEPHFSAGVRGTSGAKLGDLGVGAKLAESGRGGPYGPIYPTISPA